MSEAQHEFNTLMRDKERRTQHPEDDHDDARSFLNLSDEDDDDEDRTPPASHLDPDDGYNDPPRASTSSARPTIPLTRYGANTGPKGVISDAQHFRDSRRMHRMSVRSNATLPASRAVATAPGASWSGAAAGEKQLSDPDEDEEEDDDEGDTDFMSQWRRNRLLELQSGRHESRMHQRARSGRFWGGLATVDGQGYLDALEKSGAETVVAVYIYDDYSHVSNDIEDCIRLLAARHVDVRFVKLNFRDAEMEPAGVPALLAYRGGEKFAGLVPIIQEIPDDADLSAATIEMVLRRHQILR